MTKIIELYTKSKQYKAIISLRNSLFFIDYYFLSADYVEELNESFGSYWSRINKEVIIVDTIWKAGEIAIRELRIASGEKLIIQPEPTTIEWIRDFSGCPSASFISPEETAAYFDDGEKIKAQIIISFDGLCLIKEIGCNDNWIMGDIHSDGNIHCWAYYGALPEAILAL